MLDFPRWKIWSISLVCLLVSLLAVPSFIPERQVAQWPSWLPSSRINLGLDLSGGSYLLLEANTADVARKQVGSMEDAVRTELRRASPRIGIGDISTAGGQLSFMVRDPSQVDRAREIAYNQTQGIGLGGQRDWTVNVLDGNRIVMKPTEAGVNAALDEAMSTAREVVRRRIDPSGTKEVSVVRKGERRLEIQIPGLQDPERVKEIVGKTAMLEFKLVTELSPEQLRQGSAPPGSHVLPYPADPYGVGAIAVQRRVIVNGDMITSASQGFDENNRAIVNIGFNTTGAKRFGTATQQHSGERFAIILDDVVISAPSIIEPILGGAARITGDFTVETAEELAIQLRSGRLPVSMEVIQESSVGPELGRDSIYWGTIASVGAVAAVILFMLVTYGRFGVYATIGLILNALMILGIMALFEATLTLPGIAGFVLTIGAAVDANVLINERIREEQRRGRKTLDAVETGYREASTAIFDANITNVIAAVIMYVFGSGPISGFAVVLMIGIVTSVFTAVNVTRMFVALWVRRARPRQLNI